MSIIGRMLQGAIGWLGVLLVLVPGCILVILLPGRQRRRAFARRVARATLVSIGVRITVEGESGMPDGPCVVVANHASYLDGIILTAVLPPRFGFVIKREIASFPILAMLLRRLGSEFVERSDAVSGRSDALRIIETARAGHALGFFPEGTFFREPGLRRFRMGAFHAAVRAQLPVIPVAIRGSRALLPAGSWWPRWGPVDVVLLNSIPAPSAGTGQAARLAATARPALLAACGEPDLESSC